MLVSWLTQFLKEDESGQGITEYGAILAFVALLVGMAFTLANGGLENGISTCFHNVSSTITALNNLNGS